MYEAKEIVQGISPEPLHMVNLSLIPSTKCDSWAPLEWYLRAESGLCQESWVYAPLKKNLCCVILGLWATEQVSWHFLNLY